MTRPQSSVHGFEILSRRALPEYRADGVLLRHVGTGCEILHLASADQENLFAFCFTTPPRNDTGVSHIIEHSVLSGSDRFRVKEPFSALMKGSMHTFLNALTYPDRTVYPAASCNRTDFFNLLTVYGDAVFRPLLRKETFMQEAWRLEETDGNEKADGADHMRFAGVVYNEMKGVYSSPDSVVSEWTSRSLFPDTPYAHDSGGDPAMIPTLTLEAAREFHARYYHPSNCRIFLSGDIPLEEILVFLRDNFLYRYSAITADSVIPLQERWDSPRRLLKTFPVKKDTPLEGRSSVTMSWLLPPVTDMVEIVTHEVLSEILVESAGSPLRKTLVDSGLGEDLSPVSGLETDLKQMVFAVGLRGTEAEKEMRIESLVLETIRDLARNGLDTGLVQSMMNRIEFRHREIRGGGSPYALRLMGRALRGWVHGADPFDSLAFVEPMNELKRRIAADPRYLEGCLERSLVSNPHRLTLVVSPDRDLEERNAAAERARVQEAVGRMTPAQREAALEEARAFRQYQAAPDSPEDLARIPSLRRSDIPPEVERIPHQDTRTPASGVPLALHDIFTNEIICIDLAFPTDSLTGEMSLLLPLFGRAVCGMGLPGTRYDAVALALFRLTGGFSASLDAGGIAGRPGMFGQHMFFRTKCLRATLPEAADLVARLLAAADFTDMARLRDLLLEMRNDLKAALIPGGHQFAMLRAAGMISDAVAREEEWRGVTQLLFLDRLSKNLDAELPRVAELLHRIREDLLVRPLLLANATAAADCFPEITRAVDALAERLPARSARTASAHSEMPAQARPEARGESLVASASVGYVARALPGFRYEHPLNGPVAVLGHLLSTGYLWEKVRMEGGAYGAFSYPRNMDGLFLLGSYRDPNIAATLRAFDEGLRLMESGPLEPAEVDKAVIGTVGREDRPIDPGEKGFVCMQRKLHGITDEARQARRTSLLSVQREGIAAAARELIRASPEGFTAVIASRRSLQDAASQVPALGGRVTDLPE